MLLKGDDIDSRSSIVHLGQCLEDRLVPEIIEHLLAILEFLDAFTHAIVWRKQDATQHSLLRFRGVGRQSIYAGRRGRRFRPWACLKVGSRRLGSRVNHPVYVPKIYVTGQPNLSNKTRSICE